MHTHIRRDDRLDLAVRDLIAAIRAELAPPPEPSALVDITEAARLLGIGRTTLYALMDDGTLESRKVGRRRLIPRAALVAYAQGKTAPEGQAPGAVRTEVRDAAATPSE